jgi:serine/threonine protein kinase
LVDDIELGKYVKNEKETKEKLPRVDSRLFNTAEFKAFAYQRLEKEKKSVQNSETVFDHTGPAWRTLSQEEKAKNTLTEKDFHVMRTLGRGGYGKVCLMVKKSTGKSYAVKILKKIEIIQMDAMQKVRNEKDILIQNDHPFLVSLEFCFHSPERIYFGMKFLQGGMLLSHIQARGFFPEDQARFYAAQILLALEYLHQRNIAYRDLKPENIVMDTNGYLRLVDYGICKTLAGHDSVTKSIVGSKQYLPPEVIAQKGHNKMADWWCFGILM